MAQKRRRRRTTGALGQAPPTVEKALIYVVKLSTLVFLTA